MWQWLQDQKVTVKKLFLEFGKLYMIGKLLYMMISIMYCQIFGTADTCDNLEGRKYAYYFVI